jgi:hypothetical protein
MVLDMPKLLKAVPCPSARTIRRARTCGGSAQYLLVVMRQEPSWAARSTHPHSWLPEGFNDYAPTTNFLVFAMILRLKSYLDFYIASLGEPARIQVCSIALCLALTPDIQVNSKYFSVLGVAPFLTTYQKDDLVRMLLDKGANPNCVNPATGSTAWETLWDHHTYPPLDTAKAFIEAGADPKALLLHTFHHWILNHHPHGSRIFDLCKQAKKQSRGAVRFNLVDRWTIKLKSGW